MTTSENVRRQSTSLCTILFVVFLTLKLCEKIDWSWWWVFAPLWGPVALGLALLLVAAALFGLGTVIDEFRHSRAR